MNFKVMKRQLKQMIRAMGLEVKRIDKRDKVRFPGYVEQEFRDLYYKYCHETMVPWSGLYTVYNSVNYIIKNDIPGAFVECGVWRGGCISMIAEILKNADVTDRDIYLYDTFEGMTEPGDEDTHFSGAQFARPQYEAKKKKGEKWSYGPLDVVKENIAKTGYNPDRFHIVKGDVEQTLSQTRPEQICLLRLDTDWYASTKAEMDHLYPLLETGGIFICDDYGAWKGAYKAVNEYLTQNAIKPFIHVDTKFGGIAFLKP